MLGGARRWRGRGGFGHVGNNIKKSGVTNWRGEHRRAGLDLCDSVAQV